MKNVLIIASLFISAVAFAQSNKEDVDYIQSMYGMQKKDLVANFIKLPESQKAAFWAVYDEYETERKELGKQRIALLEKYANNYATLDDATTDEIITEMNDLGLRTDKLISTYYGKLKKASGPKPAGQFVQIEVYLLSVIRAAILEHIPFIGELDK
jgi:hypothetical protein